MFLRCKILHGIICSFKPSKKVDRDDGVKWGRSNVASSHACVFVYIDILVMIYYRYSLVITYVGSVVVSSSQTLPRQI